MKVLEIQSQTRIECIDITSEVNTVIGLSGIEQGLCHLFVPHTTAALTVNETTDADVVSDLLTYLDQQVPVSASYRHYEGNSDAHIKASLLGCSLSLPFRDRHLALGSWQGVLFCEFDGPRKRRLMVTIMESAS